MVVCFPYMTHSVQFMELFPKELLIWIRCVKWRKHTKSAEQWVPKTWVENHCEPWTMTKRWGLKSYGSGTQKACSISISFINECILHFNSICLPSLISLDLISFNYSYIWGLWDCFMFIWRHGIKHLIIIQYCHSSYLGTDFMLFVVRLGELNVFEHMPPPCGLSRIMQTHSQMCLVHWCSVEAITATIIILYLCDFFFFLTVFQKKKSQGDAETLYSLPTRQGEICLYENGIVLYTLWNNMIFYVLAVKLKSL